MPYLVDGSNLGGALAGAAGARDRGVVLRLLLDFARGGRRVVVVFDGPPDETLARAYGPLRVRFAGARPADEVILSLLGRRAGDWWVVSEDRALLAACRERGAHTLGAAELLARHGGDDSAATRQEKPEPGAAVDVTDWEDWFRRGGEGGEP